MLIYYLPLQLEVQISVHVIPSIQVSDLWIRLYNFTLKYGQELIKINKADPLISELLKCVVNIRLININCSLLIKSMVLK